MHYISKILIVYFFFSNSIAFGQINFEVFNRSFSSSSEQKTELIKVLGTMPKGIPLQLDTIESVDVRGGKRLLISYLSEFGDTTFGTPADTIEAYLFIPNEIDAPLPAIVAIHQDGPNDHIGKREVAGLEGDSTLAYGLELFRRGYVVICPDRYTHSVRRRIPNPGEKQEDEDVVDKAESHWEGQLLMSGRTSTGKEVYDLTRAVDVLYTYGFVDRSRIGAIGHSGGGYNLIPFVFYDDRVDLAVSSCGFFEKTYWFHEDAAKKRTSSGALPGLLNVGIGTDYLAYIAPRPVLLTRGLHEWGDTGKWAKFSKLDVDEYKHIEEYVKPAYEEYNAEEKFKIIYFDEEGGRHAFPPNVKSKVYTWIDSYLKVGHEK